MIVISVYDLLIFSGFYSALISRQYNTMQGPVALWTNCTQMLQTSKEVAHAMCERQCEKKTLDSVLANVNCCVLCVGWKPGFR